nr:MAG TPA: hypothetical protein [Caudoviricetes sp.]
MCHLFHNFSFLTLVFVHLPLTFIYYHILY